MRKAFWTILVCLMVVGTYAATPFLAAWDIRRAMHAADTSTLQRKVDWVSVRQSLKRSTGETRHLLADYADATGAAKPGLWQRIKAAAAPMFADPLIDRYVTAEAAPKLLAWRRTWRQQVRPALGLTDNSTLLAGTFLANSGLDRAVSFARRVERAAFQSPTRVEFELRDRWAPDRRVRATMELRDFSWVLTELQLLSVPAASPLRTAAKAF